MTNGEQIIQAAYEDGILRAVKTASAEIAEAIGADKIAVGEELMQRLGLAPEEPSSGFGAADVAGIGAAGAGIGGGQALLSRGQALGGLEKGLESATKSRQLLKEVQLLARYNNLKGTPWGKLTNRARAMGFDPGAKGPYERASNIMTQAKQHAVGKELAATEGGLGKGLNKYLSSGAMQTGGRLLRGAGVLGGGAYLGKKLHDLLTD